MDYQFEHINYHVADMPGSVAFYEKALGMKEIRRIAPPCGSVAFTMMGYDTSDVCLELMWERDHHGAYDIGDRAYHFCVVTRDFEQSLMAHREMGCVYEELPGGRCYFIEDPDGHLIEIMRKEQG